MAGAEMEHAVLLTCYMLGLGRNAYLLIGECWAVLHAYLLLGETSSPVTCLGWAFLPTCSQMSGGLYCLPAPIGEYSSHAIHVGAGLYCLPAPR